MVKVFFLSLLPSSKILSSFTTSALDLTAWVFIPSLEISVFLPCKTYRYTGGAGPPDGVLTATPF